MRVCFRAALIAVVLSAAIGVAASQERARVSLDVLLDRAGWYLDSFVEEFENVVAEETYIQDSSVLLTSFSPIGGRGRGSVLCCRSMLGCRRT